MLSQKALDPFVGNAVTCASELRNEVWTEEGLRAASKRDAGE
jgi:hypothetical protein